MQTIAGELINGLTN